MQLKWILIIGISLMGLSSQAQVNVGIVSGFDMYQRYVNPDLGTGYDRSAGSALLNISFGPKLWLGKDNFSFSVESYLNYGALALNAEEFKGLGALSVPIVGKFNFRGLSGLSNSFQGGFAFGGGVQYNRTELYGLKSSFEDAGVTRSFFPTYVAEVSAGGGYKSFTLEFYFRYGIGDDYSSSSMNFGLSTSYSLRFRLKAKELLKMPNSAPEEPIYKM